MEAFIAHLTTSFVDVPDKIALAIYFAGCSIRCPDCQNKALWERSSGTVFTLDDLLQQINQHPLAESIVFLGGEPTDQKEFLIALTSNIQLHKTLYTGREFEELPTALTDQLDMIVCGPYRHDLARSGFPASSNQRIFNKVSNSWTYQLSQ
jgi:anaerobic ribonucleoside-triphosphate reductase activating protein